MLSARKRKRLLQARPRPPVPCWFFLGLSPLKPFIIQTRQAAPLYEDLLEPLPKSLFERLFARADLTPYRPLWNI